MTTQLTSKSGLQYLIRGIAAFAALASCPAVYAQSCALCYQTAANSGSHFIQALKTGILVLLFPPLFIGIGFTILSYHKRNQCIED